MQRFKKGDRMKFKQGGEDWQEGEVLDETTIDFNPTYTVKVKGEERPVYVMDIAGTEIKHV